MVGRLFVLVLSEVVLVLDLLELCQPVETTWIRYENEYRLAPEYEYDSEFRPLSRGFFKPPALRVVVNYAPGYSPQR